MKKFSLILTFLAALASFFAADEVYPGTTLITATSWEGECFGPGPGFGALGGLSLEGFPFKYATGTAQIGYRWRDEGSGVESIPGVTLAIGRRFPFPGLISATPLIGSTVDVSIFDTDADVVANLTCAVRLSARLFDRDYLTLTPSISIPVGSNRSMRFSLAVGTLRESPWLVPVPRVEHRITADPPLFSPDGDGLDDAVRISLEAGRARHTKEWKLSAFDGNGELWRTWSGTGKAPTSIEWDGGSDSGLPCEAGADYRLVFETVDILGRTGSASAVVTVDILVVKDGFRYKVLVPNIHFPSNSFELSDESSRNLLEQNRVILERIAALFTRFPDYDLTVEGYANAVYWDNPERLAAEQKDELLALSQKRAETVRQALILLGVDGTRINILGYGGSRPVAAFSDRENRWRNRRVEFILSR